MAILLPDFYQGNRCHFQLLLKHPLLFAGCFVSIHMEATAMKKLSYKTGIAFGFLLFCPAAVLADTNENALTIIFGQVQMYGLIAFVIIVAAGVTFMKSRDKRQTPLNKIFEQRKAIHSVGPEASVTECVRLMTAGKIGALIVMDGDRLTGIFTERDALNKVLAGDLDPRKTKVSAVMTKDPYTVSPTTTVGEAMKLITTRRFRHLPIVHNDKVLAVVSSGDLTHWLVREHVGELEEVVKLAARS